MYPLDNRDRLQKFTDEPPYAAALADAPRTFLPGMQTVHRADVLPLIADRAFRIRVRFTQAPGDEGVLWAIGDPIGGMVMYVEAGRLHFHYNGFGDATTLAADRTVRRRSRRDASTTRRSAGGPGAAGSSSTALKPIGWTPLAPTLMFGVFEGLDVGIDRRGPVLWSLYERRGVVCLQRHDPRRASSSPGRVSRCDACVIEVWGGSGGSSHISV